MTRINHVFAEIAVGETAAITRVVTPEDLYVFAHVTGNLNPINLPGSGHDVEARDAHPAPSMWLGSLFSAVLGNVLPGPGTLYDMQTLHFHGRAYVGDMLDISVTVTGKRPPNTILLATRICRGGETIVEGTAEVTAPAERREVEDTPLPGLTIARHRHVERLLQACHPLPPMRTAVVAPTEETALLGALAGARARLIEPILVGDAARIAAVAASCGASLQGCEIEDASGDDAAAARAVEMVTQGRAAALMKGHLHTDTLLKHVVKSQGGLRTGRRISHVFVMDAPSLAEPLLVTDAAINIAPTLDEKVDIVQNAIDLALALGIAVPKVGILSAVETVNPRMQSTLDAAALSKMSERGQISGGIVDGPLAMDNAISLMAARTKGLTSKVAGRADILVAPNLEAGNILAKELTFAAQAEGAGLVLGARVPILLTSRSDGEIARLFSCAVAALYVHWQATGRSAARPVALAAAAE
ncbi:Phosphate acetyltransferase [Rhodovastum atsumiense]|uniref:Bifunctional enoyl-CoA hydratase/phosphate acetyltransferase n=1 Tax=Rhodovastum atsumiense TaxID=504468 RepID=A0A5M6ILW0_9PROT|nr:bifunctional enoyl-CoA hydratase/phosphate acetyltransferase [Rhodovastum atsumiense]KAA5608917.1 bifunctional enoyl-CoA hydratase/phosphate acetyltransferase [Rhodovastum atsumiense]CAH2604231.1 Phosphate acetyltransferase [Rhodovastum atsumiense]